MRLFYSCHKEANYMIKFIDKKHISSFRLERNLRQLLVSRELNFEVSSGFEPLYMLLQSTA